MARQASENCEEIFSILSDYLNLELPANICQAVEKHLAECPPCIEFLESLRKTVELCRSYRGALTEPVASDAREQLMQAYRAMLAARKSNRPQGIGEEP